MKICKDDIMRAEDATRHLWAHLPYWGQIEIEVAVEDYLNGREVGPFLFILDGTPEVWDKVREDLDEILGRTSR